MHLMCSRAPSSGDNNNDDEHKQLQAIKTQNVQSQQQQQTTECSKIKNVNIVKMARRPPGL